MHKLKSSQKDKVRQFVAFTQASEKTSIACLSAHEWKLDIAADNYFQFPERYNKDSSRQTVDRRRIDQLFNKYKDPHDEDKITAEGMMRFLSDLNLNPESLVVLVLAWKFHAATQCEFTREEWTAGMTELGSVTDCTVYC
ncbi:hypothetical protein NP493_1071g00043 [Ridgeia piscesae]|uniref:Defective in cullin neddylation protein n=1 Tax=Ridgeia piscesae TaxID=27915 RepID=A0AAD9KHE6_RIDPI|nr:hypothetical protein NP493_1071g00043 [Ridgeia piscesae]